MCVRLHPGLGMTAGCWLPLQAVAGPQLQLAPDLVIGHSLGAAAAMGSGARAVVLIAPAFPDTVAGWVRGVLALLRCLSPQGRVLRALLTTVASSPFVWWLCWRIAGDRVVEPFAAFRARHQPDPGEATERWVDAFVTMLHVPPPVHACRHPVLIVVGECDPVVPASRFVNCCKSSSTTVVHIIRGAGHLPHETHAVECWAAITAWLTGDSSFRFVPAAGPEVAGWRVVVTVLLLLLLAVLVRRRG